MNISKQRVTLFLDQDGRAILEAAEVPVGDSAGVLVDVAETDDLGVWIRINRQDVQHFLLIRWEYVLCVDAPENRLAGVGVTK